MKTLITLLFILSIGYAQKVETFATNYFYFYPDSTQDVSGECYFDVTIGTDTIELGTIPKMELVIQKREIPLEYDGGQLLEMWAKDQNGVGCIIKLLVAATKEIHIIYKNAEFAYILE